MGDNYWKTHDGSGQKARSQVFTHDEDQDINAGWSDLNGEAADRPNNGILDKVAKVAPYGVLGLMGYGALTGGSGLLGGLGGSGGGGAASGLGADVASTMAVPGTVGTGGVMSGVGGFLSKNPKLMLAALSLLGGSDSGGGGGQQRERFKGELTNPEDSLYRALAATHRSGQAFAERPNAKLSALLPAAPQPVTYAGVQIGGGMGHNPAEDPMEVDRSWLQKYDPFQSVAQGEFNSAPKPPKKQV